MYYIATATLDAALGRGTVVFAVESAFGVGPASPGDEMVFTRSRIRVPTQFAGTYTLQHPWGTDTFTVTPADVAAGDGLSDVKDIGAVRDFLVAGTGPISRFVSQASPAPPAGWVGT